MARETGMDAKARAFRVRSHLSAEAFARLPLAIGLNDVCGWCLLGPIKKTARRR